MSRQKQIMYGVTDFALMRAENAYFVDRTDLIREVLEYYRKNEFDFDVEYMGLLTIGGSSMGDISFRIPNLTVAEFMHDFILSRDRLCRADRAQVLQDERRGHRRDEVL